MRARRGYTLLELMVVVLIVAIVMAIVIPMIARSRYRTSRRSVCASNLRQIGTAMMMFADDPANGRFPKAKSGDPMVSLNLLYKGYINDKRVFSCNSNPVTPEKLDDVQPIKDGLVYADGTYLSPTSCSYGYDPDVGMNESRVAIMADWKRHGGAGWNVLFVGGNVEWRDSAVNKLGKDDAGKEIVDPDIFAANPELPREVDSFIRQ